METIVDRILFEDAYGCSVTDRTSTIKQPKGGYLPPSWFTVDSLGEGEEALNPEENVSPALIGIAVDYLTRYMQGTSVIEAFHASLLGAYLIGAAETAKQLMSGISGLDNLSIQNAIQLCGFDVCLRSDPSRYKPVDEICPDENTIENVRTMVKRSLHFFEIYGPRVLDGFTFSGAYTEVVSSGDGDFTTSDTLWDFKVSKGKISTEHTLQLLMYWRMGLYSSSEFEEIKYLGIFNPRLNTVSRISVDKIPDAAIYEVETKVIGYKD